MHILGYPSDRPGWMFWDSRTRQVVHSDSAIFDEREFRGATRQIETADIPINLLPNWNEQDVNVEQENDIPPLPNIPANVLDNAPDLPVLVAGHPYHLQNPLTLLPHQRPCLFHLHGSVNKSAHYSMRDITPGAQQTYHLNAPHEHATKGH